MIALRGGLDLHTPQQALDPGHARDAVNFECSINGGYTRIPGYERFDGRPSPSDATYTLLQLNITGAVAVGNVLTGATSGATAEVCTVSGSLVAVTRAAGSFSTGETLTVGGTAQATLTEIGGAEVDAVADAQYVYDAAERYRAVIQAVPGSGPIRGVVTFKGVTYAVRDNAAGTAAAIYKSSAAGWTLVPLLHEVAFTAGSGTPPAEGAAITKGTVSAVVRRVVTESGDWLAGNAAGRFIIEAPTGGNFSAGALTAGATATLSGAQSAVTLLPAGRFEFSVGNAGNGVRIYGCDGVNRGFEFDGAVLVPIRTGMASDVPTRVRVHKSHLFFAFGPSAQHSGTGTPYRWSVISGAGEILVSSDITAFLVLPGDANTAAMAILTNGGMFVLYGTSSSNWNLAEFNNSVGAKARTAQIIGQAFVLDDRGVIGLAASQEFGNFASAALTVNIRSFLQPRRLLATDSLVNREKSQYRLFFSDGYGLYCTLVNGEFRGAMPVYFPNAVACACSGDSANGSEASYFGSTNGYVYRLDAGTSFDGANISANLTLTFASQGNARVRKRYRKAAFEMQGDGYASFSVGYELGYGSDEIEQQGQALTASADVNPVYWDSFTWDRFVWDGRSIAPSEVELGGTAENISLRFEQEAGIYPPYTINSVTLHWTARRGLR